MKFDNRTLIIGAVSLIVAYIAYMLLTPTNVAPPQKPSPETFQPAGPKTK